jgi:ubiquinone/menaquinone biosynthesis C-methylase UbiE
MSVPDLAPAEALPLPDGSVDYFVSRVALPCTDIPAALTEAARVLVPGDFRSVRVTTGRHFLIEATRR